MNDTGDDLRFHDVRICLTDSVHEVVKVREGFAHEIAGGGIARESIVWEEWSGDTSSHWTISTWRSVSEVSGHVEASSSSKGIATSGKTPILFLIGRAITVRISQRGSILVWIRFLEFGPSQIAVIGWHGVIITKQVLIVGGSISFGLLILGRTSLGQC